MFFKLNISIILIIAVLVVQCYCAYSENSEFNQKLGRLALNLPNHQHKEKIVDKVLKMMENTGEKESKIERIQEKLSSLQTNDDMLADRILAIIEHYTAQNEIDTTRSLGCFEDHLTQRMFRGRALPYDEHLNPEKCVSLCKMYRFVYAGTQHYHECYCGDYMPEEKHNMRKPESECNTYCKGDHSRKCGGAWRMHIYKTGIENYRFDGKKMIEEPSSFSDRKYIA